MFVYKEMETEYEQLTARIEKILDGDSLGSLSQIQIFTVAELLRQQINVLVINTGHLLEKHAKETAKESRKAAAEAMSQAVQ